MNLSFLTEDVKIRSRKLFAITILASGSLAWVFLLYFSFDSVFQSLSIDLFWVNVGKAIFLCFGAFSAIVGSVISGRFSRRKLLWSSTTLGIIATISLAIIPGSTLFFLVSFVMLGISLGLGYPCFTSFLADGTVIEERARVSGLIFFETFIMVLFALVVVEFFNFGLVGVVLLAVLLRSTSYLALIFDPCKREHGKNKSWRSVLSHRGFSLYLFPWLMFNIASGLISFVWRGLPQTSEYEWALAIGNPLHILSAGVFGFIAGFVADHFGRKQPIIIGMVMLGVSFAFLGLVPSHWSVLVYLTLSGVAWGFLMVVYLAVPGDLAPPGSREKFYALGIIIPLVIYMGLPAISDLLNIGIPPSAISSVLSIILFLCVIPVLRASETLPETKLGERKMMGYVKKVRKIARESKNPEQKSV